MTRVVAIDWSGAKVGAARKIWRADVVDGELVYLRNGFSREQVAAQLIALAKGDEDLFVGLDFSFSFPAWFMEQHGIASAQDLWRRAADGRCEEWLASCDPPFWGRRGTRRPSDCEVYRNTERAIAERTGFRPMSTFQIGGAGAPGTGSLRGMAVLDMLRDAGFRIWPFDEQRLPSVVEIYPRLFTGKVRKSDGNARAELIACRYSAVRGDFADAIRASEDAFDAAISAIEMHRRGAAIAPLPVIDDAVTRVEGAIWFPDVEA